MTDYENWKLADFDASGRALPLPTDASTSLLAERKILPGWHAVVAGLRLQFYGFWLVLFALPSIDATNRLREFHPLVLLPIAGVWMMAMGGAKCLRVPTAVGAAPWLAVSLAGSAISWPLVLWSLGWNYMPVMRMARPESIAFYATLLLGQTLAWAAFAGFAWRIARGLHNRVTTASVLAWASLTVLVCALGIVLFARDWMRINGIDLDISYRQIRYARRLTALFAVLAALAYPFILFRLYRAILTQLRLTQSFARVADPAPSAPPPAPPLAPLPKNPPNKVPSPPSVPPPDPLS